MIQRESTTNFSDIHRKVEAFLAEIPVRSQRIAGCAEDVRRLVRELDRHRLELELRNEELCQVQAELLASGHLYADLYNLAPIAYFTLDENARIVHANATAAEMLGMEREKLLGRYLTDFILSEDQDVFYRQRKRLLEEGKRICYDLRFNKETEELFHAFVILAKPSEALDQPGRFRLMVSDISHRKAAETDNLRRLKDRYRAIVMDQSELICRFDPEGRITFVNDAYCRYFGINYQDILGTAYLPDIFEEDVELVRNHFRDLTPADPVRVIEHRVHRPDGRVAWQQWSGRALFDQEGRIVEYQAVGRDITELKQAEERLQYELKLRQLFLDALPCMAVLVHYPSREIVAVNKEAAAVGARPGTPCFETFARSKDPCPWCLADRLWETRQPQNAKHWSFGRYWDTYWIPVNGELYLQYAFDITEHEKNKLALQKAKEECERKVAERTLELQQSHEQLLHSEKLAAVGNLSASIAHEFNNPLQSIMTIIKGVSQYAPLDDKEAELLNLALQECKRMSNLIANLQDFYRPSTGRLEPLNLHEVLDALLLMVKKDFHIRKLVVVKDFARNLPTVTGIVDQLKQVFLNLLKNAADACEGGGTIAITTDVVDRGNVAVHIRDNGVGIDPADLGHIFQPFFTTKSRKKGTGLGLSVSYGIIKEHGGEIVVRSERGSGSLFSVILPVNREHHEQEEHSAGR